MKKVWILLMVAALAVTLFACGANGNDYPEYPDYSEDYVEVTQPEGQPEPAPFGLSIGVTMVDGASHIINAAAHMQGAPDISGDTLLIKADVPLYNLGVVFFSNDVENEEIVFVVENTVAVTDELAAEETLMITNFLSMGSLPWNGIVFGDANGTVHHFAIVQNQADEGPAYFLTAVQLAERG
jgi:hypothetical protein